MTLKSTLLPVLVFLSILAFGSGPTITPVVSPTSICQGDTISVAILTSDTFVTGNVFYVQLSDSTGSFTLGTIIDTVVSQGNDTIDFVAPVVAKNSSQYKIRVVSSGGTIGLDSTALTIHHTPTVNFQLPQPSYCSYSYTVPLAGGSPLGGVYSGNYVANNAFETYLSGTGTFKVYYIYTDSVGTGCYAEDSAAIAIVACPAPSVAVQVSPSTICPGSSVNITIETSNVIGSDNVFTIQLSDSSGSFANPTLLGTDTSSSGNTISVVAPVEPSGTHYQVRVVASDPSTVSVAYNVSYKALLAPPNVQLDTTGRVSLCTKDSLVLSVDSLNGVLYQWSFNGVPFSVSKYKYTAKDSGLYVVAFTDTILAGCSSGADSVFVGVYSYPAKPTISPSTTVNFCGSGTVALSTPANNAVTFQWINDGQNISGATNDSYTATATGVYLVEAINSPAACATKSNTVPINILPAPAVTFTLPFDSFCVHSAPVALSGGLPTGGYYSGNYTVDNATFNADSSGVGAFEIYYTYLDSIGCSGTDSTKIKVYNCTTLPSGVNEVSDERDFELYPNPATGVVNININLSGKCIMHVYNMLGQQIGNRIFNQQLTYSVAELPAGIYMVEISNVSESWKAVKRLVIQ